MRKNKFFIIYGASGSGKSTILNFVKNIKNVSIHKKDTSRSLRKNETKNDSLDIRFVKQLNKKEYELIYSQWGNHYGIRRDLISKAIKNNEFHFIIIGDIKIVKKFISKHKNSVVIYVHYDPSEIPNRFKNRDPLEFKQRKNKIEKQYLDFIKNNTLFNHVIVNFWDIKHSKKQILNILKLYK